MKNQIIAQGAEAVLVKQGDFLIKNRIRKSYRNEILDKSIRLKRTRHESRIIEKASKFIPVPKILETSQDKIKMSFIEGKKISEFLDKMDKKEQKAVCKQIANNISKLHENHIIHGDLTTSNMIWADKIKFFERQSAKRNMKRTNPSNNTTHIDKPHTDGILYFIDFGLAFHSQRIEDKAVDLHLLKQALESKHFKNYEFLLKECLNSYKWSKSEDVLKQLEKVESRGRYKGKH
jgi:tRNA A-37 threonylcarbamoyl transferase component Bud32